MSITLSASIKNQGKASASATQVAFYLTKSASSITGATLLDTQNVGSLSAGATLALTTTLSIPSSTSPGTFYVVAVADPSNAIKESNETNNTRASGAIAVKDLTPPTISAVNATQITASNATITWTTDKTSTSQTDYGTTAAYGSSTSPDSSLVTTHAVTLSGLTAGMVHHFRVQSRDAAGNAALSGDFTFTAAAPTAEIAYFVAPNGSDTADGSETRPWATIQHAADSVGPGAIVHVTPGDYPQAIVSGASGTAEARIRFISDTTWGARIVATAGPTSIAWDNRGDYVDIVGFDITGDGYIGILNRGSYVRISKNQVHDIPAPGCTSNGGAGIDNGNYSAHDSGITGNLVHDIGDPAAPCSGVHGIYHSNLRGAIQNNIVYRVVGYGIHLWHAANAVTIANNLVMRTGSGGIIIGAGDSRGGVTVDNCTVSNNIVVHNRALDPYYSSVGIRQYGSVGTNNRYLNNLLFDNDVNFMNQSTTGGIPNTGTVLAYPKFLNDQPDGTGDYHLNAGSPAIDAGTGDGAPLEDFDGGSRPQGIGWDIGPYEWRP